MSLVSNFAMPVIFKTKESFESYKNKFTKAEVEIRPVIAGNIAQQPFFRKHIKGNFLVPMPILYISTVFILGIIRR